MCKRQLRIYLSPKPPLSVLPVPSGDAGVGFSIARAPSAQTRGIPVWDSEKGQNLTPVSSRWWGFRDQLHMFNHVHMLWGKGCAESVLRVCLFNQRSALVLCAHADNPFLNAPVVTASVPPFGDGCLLSL